MDSSVIRRQQIIQSVENLPAEALSELEILVEYLQYKVTHTPSQTKTDSLTAISRLREIGKKMPAVDAVELVRESRNDLEQRGII
jgi:hypothetical protein